jgi:hypothetical protein
MARDFGAERLLEPLTADWSPQFWRRLSGACHSAVVITPKSQMTLSRLLTNEAKGGFEAGDQFGE